jgi:excisionase family DNA binding protein
VIGNRNVSLGSRLGATGRLIVVDGADESASARRTMSRMKIEQSGQQISDIMDVAEAAQYLKISVSQLYDLTRHRARVRQDIPIPCVRLGVKSLRFRRSSLDRWLSELEKAG